MPRVPTQDNFQTSISTSRGPAFQGSTGPQAGQVAADQVQQMGAAAGRVGDVASQISMNIQQETNRVKVVDAVNQAKESMFDLQAGQNGFQALKGYNALHRPDGQSLVDEYGAKFKDSSDAIEKGLGNDAQRAMYREHVGAMQSQLHGQLNEHTMREFQTYQGSVYDGAAQTAKRQIELNYNRTEPGGMIDQAIQTIEASVREKARLTGASQEMADNVARREISGAHRLALRTALERNDLAFADGYLKKYRGSMEPDDILAVQGTITKEMDQRQAFAAASTAVTLVAPKLAPTDWDRAINITIQTESAGNPNAVSPKGAKGLMQVMPATSKNPGFGIKPSNGTPDDDVRLGKEYLGAMLKRYDGDIAKTWAAYNGGPGAVDKAIADQAKNRAGTQGASWLTYMPAETQAYVSKNLQAMASGQGSQVATLADVQAQVHRVLGPDAKPHVIKAAEDEAERRWNDQIKAKKEQEDGLVAEAQRTLLANGGDFGTLSANLRAAVPAGKVDDLMSFGDKIRKGQDAVTDWGLFYKLNNDPALLKETNLMALRSKLGNTEFKQLADDQAKISKGGDHLTQLQSAKDVLNGFMEQAGINPNPKYDDKEGTAKVGKLTSEFQARVSEREQSTGKKLGTADLLDVASSLFAPVKVPGLIWGTKDKVAADITGSDPVVVPDADRSDIASALRRAGRPVTDQAIESLYRARLRIPQRTAQN
jgi:soluble lytic murein transglycosylase